jgi:hypothetical protein
MPKATVSNEQPAYTQFIDDALRDAIEHGAIPAEPSPEWYVMVARWMRPILREQALAERQLAKTA